MMVAVAISIKGICCYEILAKNETVHAARYLEFLKRFMDRWHGNRRHAIWLLDDNARPMPQLFSGLSKGKSNARFKRLILSTV